MGLTMSIQKLVSLIDIKKTAGRMKENNTVNKPIEIKPTADYRKLSQNLLKNHIGKTASNAQI